MNYALAKKQMRRKMLLKENGINPAKDGLCGSLLQLFMWQKPVSIATQVGEVWGTEDEESCTCGADHDRTRL